MIDTRPKPTVTEIMKFMNQLLPVPVVSFENRNTKVGGTAYANPHSFHRKRWVLAPAYRKANQLKKPKANVHPIHRECRNLQSFPFEVANIVLCDRSKLSKRTKYSLRTHKAWNIETAITGRYKSVITKPSQL